jgi:hypothetical protein
VVDLAVVTPAEGLAGSAAVPLAAAGLVGAGNG